MFAFTTTTVKSAFYARAGCITPQIQMQREGSQTHTHTSAACSGLGFVAALLWYILFLK